MKFLVTTVDDQRRERRDVLVNAATATPVRRLAAQLVAAHQGGAPGEESEAAAAEQDTPLYLGDRLLDPDLALAASGIRDGSTLGLGRPVADAASVYGPARDEMPTPKAPGSAPVVEIQVIGGPDAGQVYQLGVGTHLIGPRVGSSVPLAGRGVPEEGLRLTVRPDGTVLAVLPEDDGQVRLSLPEAPAPRPRVDVVALPPEPDPGPGLDEQESDGLPRGWTAWELDGELVVGEHLLRAARPTLADAAVVASPKASLDFNRPPRLLPPLQPETFRLPGPPEPPKRRPLSFLLIIAPMFMGVAMVYFFHSFLYLMFMVLSPVLAVGNWISGRRGGRKEYLEGVANYRLRRASLEADVRAKVEHERRVRVASAPDPAVVGLMAVGPGARLWERRPSDPDNLVLRIGTTQQQSLLQIDDGSREDNHRTAHWQIPDMPIGVDLAGSQVVGVAGPEEPARALARWAVAQAAVLHSPRDLKICVLTDSKAADAWEWARWLPHARSGLSAAQDNAPVILLGNDPETVANRVTELINVIRNRNQAQQATLRGALLSEPDVLVVLDGARELRDVPGMVQVLKEGPLRGIHLLCLDREERMLPEEASAVVSIARDTLTLRRTGMPDISGIRPDYVTAEWAERLARGIAPVHDVTPDAGGGLPDSVSLLDLLDLEPPTAEEVLRRWERRPASTSAPVGQGFDRTVAFDLVKDGPHALIAGTTGSGKSELLQTFVASLAAVNRPDELTFVLVDYKGGSAFKDCVRLPHTLGMVTDLDSHLVQRALASLTAELLRREHLLAAAGAKDHPEYRALRRRDPNLPPMPRLLLVIDEFATLAREIPDFIPGLVGIAQRGRSLGLHMVLATQRPAGVVTSDIRANTNLRISLRVTDATESTDVLDVPDAASISPATPGRALVRTGHRSAMSFQTAYVGAPRPQHEESQEQRPAQLPDDDAGVWMTPLSWQGLGRPVEAPQESEDEFALLDDEEGPTDLMALVDALVAAAEQYGHQSQPSPWLPPLADTLTLSDLPEPAAPTGDGRLVPVAWAREDLPQLQAQPPVFLDLDTFSHLFVLGMPRSGRSQTLRTMAGALARANSCADLHLYAIDAAGGALSVLSALPHTGAVVPRADLERLGRLLNRLTAELVRRQELMTTHSAGHITELRAALPANQRPPHLMLLIDGWDTLSALIGEIEEGRMVSQVGMLLREGAAVGVHVVATSERALMAGRIAALNDNKLLLRMNDVGDYTMSGIPREQIPSVIPAGRGFRTDTGGELQVAVLPGGLSGPEQADAVQKIGTEAAARDLGVPAPLRPFRVETLPMTIGFKEAYGRAGAAPRGPLTAMLGLGGDNVAPVWVDFAGVASTYSIVGPPGSGRSTALLSLAASLLRAGTGVVALTPRESPLRGLAGHPKAVVLSSPAPGEEELRAALETVGGAAVVMVDDADLLGMSPLDGMLRDIASSGRDRSVGLAVAGPAEALVSPLSTWIGQVRRSRKGLLLSPQTISEGDVLGLRLPHNVIRVNRVPGRAFTVDEAGALMTVLVPETVAADAR
ncbi:S-DNA-T family DNA segregation ATPase FtsK/SpoIIIE [Streptomyces sp. TLI_55]|uniref:FtsK/SpoIIIE domain-containing protein n=1 Tax=Streptomyces sp. TLI_55 TaxID=1938861 RepID=UPI000BC5B9A3|nr:FtsK/SpoIIIE domain-containing protein [Streptomyces sp. TLI_55]SNX88344.1 S-DNA-T family DNA segregation ATPase FtsK/SpoIIIE [Streptomyces sp. TLI_55]